MKRVQIILEEWQHEWLAKEANVQEVTMSALLREILTEAIERKQVNQWQDDPIWGIVGLGQGPEDGITSENLDEFLYGPPVTKQELKIAESKDDGTDYRGQ